MLNALDLLLLHWAKQQQRDDNMRRAFGLLLSYLILVYTHVYVEG